MLLTPCWISGAQPWCEETAEKARAILQQISGREWLKRKRYPTAAVQGIENKCSFRCISLCLLAFLSSCHNVVLLWNINLCNLVFGFWIVPNVGWMMLDAKSLMTHLWITIQDATDPGTIAAWDYHHVFRTSLITARQYTTFLLLWWDSDEVLVKKWRSWIPLLSAVEPWAMIISHGNHEYVVFYVGHFKFANAFTSTATASN